MRRDRADEAHRLAGPAGVCGAQRLVGFVPQDYFEPDWQRSFWGADYPRLLEMKHRYDPANFFRVHHGVGSDIR